MKNENPIFSKTNSEGFLEKIGKTFKTDIFLETRLFANKG